MAEIGTLKVEWRGGLGGVGLTQFNFLYGTDAGAAAAATAVGAFFNYVGALIPNVYQLVLLSEVLVTDEATGTLTDARTVTPWAPKTGSGSSTSYAAPCGGFVNWRTGLVTGGRRLSGRTFVVPIAASNYDSGSLVPTAVTALSNGAQAIVDHNVSNTDGAIVVRGRPLAGTPQKAARPGVSAPITSFSVPDKVAILSGRRD